MCRLAEEQFAPELSSASVVRHWLVDHLYQWQLEQFVDVSALLTTELVANAVLHTSSGPSVAVAVVDGTLEVGVSDREPRFPRLEPGTFPAARTLDELDEEAFMAEGGRGLLLVDALADEWGTTSTRLGKQVWFRLHFDGGKYGSGCRCPDPQVDHVRLGSGRQVNVLGNIEGTHGGDRSGSGQGLGFG